MRELLLKRACGSWLALALLLAAAGPGTAQKGGAKDQVIAISAIDLTKAYGDSFAANQKYYNKTLLVEGKILANTRIIGPVLILEGFKGTNEREARRVFCNLPPGAKVSDLKRGDTVRVRGRCNGQASSQPPGVDLKNCEVVK